MTVGSVSNAIRIMRHLAASDRPVGVNAIAREVGVSVSSCFNILRTLVAEGVLVFDPASKHYRLDSSLGGLVEPAIGLQAHYDRVSGRLQGIAREYTVTCGLWAKIGDRVVLQRVNDSPGKTRIHMEPGQRLPRHAGAMGRCIAAGDGLSRDQVEDALDTVNWQRRPGTDAYLEEVHSVAETGWAVDDGSFLRGVTTIAVPVRDGAGAIRYCVTATMFQEQYRPAERVEIAGRLQTVARMAEGLIGGAGADRAD